MVVEVWSVYKKDSQECCMFKTKELAENQKVFNEFDLITMEMVDLTDDEILELERGNPVW